MCIIEKDTKYPIQFTYAFSNGVSQEAYSIFSEITRLMDIVEHESVAAFLY